MDYLSRSRASKRPEPGRGTHHSSSIAILQPRADSLYAARLLFQTRPSADFLWRQNCLVKARGIDSCAPTKMHKLVSFSNSLCEWFISSLEFLDHSHDQNKVMLFLFGSVVIACIIDAKGMQQLIYQHPFVEVTRANYKATLCSSKPTWYAIVIIKQGNPHPVAGETFFINWSSINLWGRNFPSRFSYRYDDFWKLHDSMYYTKSTLLLVYCLFFHSKRGGGNNLFVPTGKLVTLRQHYIWHKYTYHFSEIRIWGALVQELVLDNNNRTTR